MGESEQFMEVLVVRKLVPFDTQLLVNFFKEHQDTLTTAFGNFIKCGFEYSGEFGEGEYYGLFDEDKYLKGVACHFWNGNLILEWPLKQACQLIQLIQSFERPIMRIEGPEELVQTIVPNVLFGAKISVKTTMSLDTDKLSVRGTSNDDITMEVPTMDDVGRLTEMRVEFCMESYGILEATVELKQLCRQTISDLLSLGTLRILSISPTKHSKEIVAMLAYNSATENSVMIGNMFVPKECRRRGYARMLMKDCLEEIRREGRIRKVFLYTGNPAAVALYGGLGFIKLGSLAVATSTQLQ